MLFQRVYFRTASLGRISQDTRAYSETLTLRDEAQDEIWRTVQSLRVNSNFTQAEITNLISIDDKDKRYKQIWDLHCESAYTTGLHHLLRQQQALQLHHKARPLTGTAEQRTHPRLIHQKTHSRCAAADHHCNTASTQPLQNHTPRRRRPKPPRFFNTLRRTNHQLRSLRHPK